MVDREPQPSDGPDYHADHDAWERRQTPTPAPQEPVGEICRVVIEELAYTYEAGYTGAQMQEAVRQTLLTAVQPLSAALAAEKAAHERTNAKLAAALDEIALVNELLAAEKVAHAETRATLEEARLWGFDDAYHWYEDVIEWLGDWHDEESSDGPEDLIAGVKAYVTELETAREQALAERDELQRLIDTHDAMREEGQCPSPIGCYALATTPAEHVEPT